MQLNEMTIEQAKKAEIAAYVRHFEKVTDAVTAMKAGLDLKPWAEEVEKTREEWHQAEDVLDIVLVLNGEPARRRS